MLPSLLLSLLLGAAAPPQVQIQASSQDVRPVRIASTAFGRRLEVEVRDLPRDTAKAAIQAALDEVAATERLLRPDSSEPAGGVGSLNTAAGHGPQPVDPKLMPLLVRAQEFCFWSEGAHGPLGRNLYEAWGLRSAPTVSDEPLAATLPDPGVLQEATAAARCESLVLDPAKDTAELAAGSRLDLGGFAEGHAVDRAVDTLRQNGVANGFVQLGPIQRGLGKGGDGRGWKIVLPRFTGMDRPAGRFLLRDRAAAVLSTQDGAMRIADQAVLPYLNQRTGLPAPGVVGVAAVTDLAVDAQALAIAMILTGPREGQLRLGSLRPSPSVLWFLGSGSGAPLQADHHWGDVIAASR
ncbi:MAG TPA: FAD:protein FMN transferase [Thermoanaerobaculia bacterium]|jgi:thiamine biosynthesis lipoprotein|nr:FAD:protein FMN transferase [Thermoanaerobaculia bacterium]